MTARKTTPAARPTAVTQPALTEAERQQMTVAAESAVAMRRGFEAMRQINDRALQATLSRFTAAAETLKTPREPLQLLTVSTELMRLQIEGATSYWQDLSGAALEMQAQLLGCSSHLVESDAMLQAASAMEALPAFPLFLHGLNAGSDKTAEPRPR